MLEVATRCSKWFCMFYTYKFIVQVAVLTKKLDAQSQLSVLRRRGDEPTKQLHFEIQRLKSQKVTFC